MNNILVIIQNIIQYYSLRPLLVEMRKNKLWDFDIFLYGSNGTDGFEEIAKEVGDALKKDNFIFYTTPPKKEYKICLSPYQNMTSVRSKYLLGYCYGAATTKPHLTLLPEMRMKFHGIFLHDTYGASLLNVYAKTYIVPDLYLKKVPTHAVSEKPIVLYLPTYNDSCTNDVIESLNKLRDKYYIVAKGHHGTEHLNTESSKRNSLEDIADEYYSSSYYAQQLFDRADVVLSDNSGAVMDALYINVPVCIATDNINKKIADINTLQYELVEDGIIPYSSKLDAKSIDALIKKTLKRATIKKQITRSDVLFTNKNGGVEDWLKIISLYMDDKVNQNYCKLHDYYTTKNEERSTKYEALQNELSYIKNELTRVKAELEFYETKRFLKKVATFYKKFEH